jgi:hypothetical protein
MGLQHASLLNMRRTPGQEPPVQYFEVGFIDEVRQFSGLPGFEIHGDPEEPNSVSPHKSGPMLDH